MPEMMGSALALAKRLRRIGPFVLSLLLSGAALGVGAYLALALVPGDGDGLTGAEGASSLSQPSPTQILPPTPTWTPVPTPTATPQPLPPAPPPPAPPPLPPPGPWERWIDVNLTTQRVTAMLGDQAWYTALATTGMPGWETPTGSFRILYRVYDETMRSETLGIPPGPDSYVQEHVLFTQYFTRAGHALHLNYWRPEYYFGSVPSSHGCVGLRYADAEFFWNFATVGTRVEVHY